MSYLVPYVDDAGNFWFERGVAPWPRVLREAGWMARELGGDVMEYEGIVKDVRVSDEHEYVHGDDDACADAQDVDLDEREVPGSWTPCCRTIDAYAFRSVER